MWHGCNTNTVDAFFTGKALGLHELFNGFIELIQQCGPITVVPTKSRIKGSMT